MEVLVINIKVVPRSKRAEIVGDYKNGLKVKVTSPPVGGKANKELIEILAREFGIKRRDVEIISGKKSKNKIVRLTGIEKKKS